MARFWISDKHWVRTLAFSYKLQFLTIWYYWNFLDKLIAFRNILVIKNIKRHFWYFWMIMLIAGFYNKSGKHLLIFGSLSNWMNFVLFVFYGVSFWDLWSCSVRIYLALYHHTINASYHDPFWIRQEMQDDIII